MLKTPTIDAREIHPLTDFLRNAKAHIARLKETGQPEVLTVNGRAEVVVLDAASYQAMIDQLDRADLIESLKQSIRDVEEGRVHSLESFEAELRFD